MPGQIMEGFPLRHRGAPRRPGEDDRLGHLRQGEFQPQGRGRGKGRAQPDHERKVEAQQIEERYEVERQRG